MGDQRLDPAWSHLMSRIGNRCKILCLENQSYIIVGWSGLGNSTFVYSFLSNIDHLIDTKKPNMILYCYKEWKNLFNHMLKGILNIHFQEGMVSP